MAVDRPLRGIRVALLPMFPLGTVLLPHQMLPLHVFEPRYRALARDVLAGDREFGVVLIRRGHEVGGGDQRYDHGTIARVLEAEETGDGRWLLVAAGTRRLHVQRWLPDDPYPRAEVEELPDPPAAGPAARDALLARLRRVLALQRELGQAGAPPTAEFAADPDVAAWQVAAVALLTPLDAQRVLEADASERVPVLEGLLGEIEETLRLQLGQHG